MSLYYLEFTKILNRRLSFYLLLSTILLFPVIIKVISHVSVTIDHLPEGFYTENVAFATIMYSQLYFFIPVWIFIFIGQELSSGYVNRVIFLRSRKYYFLSKIFYGGTIAIFFTLVGLISLIISIQTAPISNLDTPLMFYFQYLTQAFFANFSFILFLLAFVFLLKSPVISFMVYFGYSFAEGIIFIFIKDHAATWLPLHLVRSLYCRDGDARLENYYNPFVTDPVSIILPLVFVTLLTITVYYIFQKSSLKPLSD